MKDILIVLGLGGLALYLFGSKSPSPIFTNPKISIPDKVAEIETTVEKTGTGIVRPNSVNAIGEQNSIENLFTI